METRDIALRRLRNQHLVGEKLQSAEAVVGWLGAVQGQEYWAAKWALSQRTNGLTDASADALLASGAILRTHMLRPTWHLVLPTDIRWIMSVTAPRVRAGNRYWLRSMDLDAGTLARAHDVLGAALTGRQLTRTEIQSALRERGIDAAGPRLAYILMEAELDLLIVSGALKGKQHTYSLLDERDAPPNPYSPDEALAELTLRYFTSRGPSTIADFTWWSSLTVAQVRRGLDIAGASLERAVVDGAEYWWSPSGESAPASTRPSPSALLVYGLDELIVGYQKTRAVIDVAGLAKGLAAGETERGFYHAILIDDQICGLWRRVVGKVEVVIETRLLRPLSAPERDALEAAAHEYGTFVGLPAKLA